MLRKYAEAVRRMSAASMPPGSPRSWAFQWYIHATPAPKASELARIYGSSQSNLRALADKVWGTCQAHSFNSDPDMFLPWHRMYLLGFEAIIRAVLNDDDFALPYWDYTQPGSRSIPVEFRSPAVPELASLFRPNRKRLGVDINAGEPMDKGTTISPYNLAAMTQPSFSLFSAVLDGGLHGRVHTGVGDSSNMAAIETAAGDPIFWLHHCNIDRIWAGWDPNGGQGPASSKDFDFASPDPAGQKVTFSSANVGKTDALGYRYDALPQKPQLPISLGAAGGPRRIVARSRRDVSLTAPVAVPLRPVAVDGVISGSVASATATGRIYLLLDDLQSNIEPETLYELFVDLPANPTAEQKRAHYLGAFTFFGAIGEGHHASGRQRTIEITEQLRSLRNSDRLRSETSITILPVHSGKGDARPIVGVIELVRR